ncbi:hypothetical protein LT493_25045 [Streptomyces tricolor]|nr:hypothetical protein [Streptomyces tricolor]
MSGRTDSDTDPVIAEDTQDADDAQDGEDGEESRRGTPGAPGGSPPAPGAPLPRGARRPPAAASPVQRRPPSPAAYALGAAVCAVAAVLGAKGRTRRALWLLIAGTMVAGARGPVRLKSPPDV